MELSEKLLEKLKNLPEKPGVYIMRGAAGEIIYIGKAAVLKNRVRQYFFNTQKDEKVRAMASSVADFDYIITLSEKDALSLEANLVRKHKPRYNILLKDDRHNPYIRIDLKQKFPCIEVTRRIKSDGARYFGPYFFGVRVAEVIDVLKSAYRVRCCPKSFFSKKRECLNYHIKLCLAPCQNRVSESEYRQTVDKAVAFLSGKDSDAERLITEKMAAAAENEEFERAIRYRKQLAMLKKLKDRVLSELRDNRDLDAVSFVFDGSYGAAAVVIVRGGKLMGALKFGLDGASLFGSDGVSQFLTQYYAGQNATVPPEILLETEFEKGALEEYLYSISGKKTAVVFPKIGIKKKILGMAEENARDELEKSLDRRQRDYELCEGANERLKELLGLDTLRRIECYDISHLSGTDQVASGVAFINGRAEKSEYRRYKIKTVAGADDYKCLAEVISRRLGKIMADGGWRMVNGDQDKKKSSAPHPSLLISNSKSTAHHSPSTIRHPPIMPDLIVIDGGKGQLNSAHAAMQTAGAEIPMISLAERDEEIFTLGSPEPIRLKKDNFALKLLQRIRDEAHRFAVTYHRSLRAKKIGSVLEQIRGIGSKKRQILLKAFSSVRAIETADIETLAAVEGIDRKTAEAVAAFFRG